MDIFVGVPSYLGISRDKVRAQCGAAVLEQAGHRVLDFALGGSALLDLARAEVLATFKRSPGHVFLALDDDMSIAGESLLAMMAADVDVVSAPYRLRGALSSQYAIKPSSTPTRHNGVRLVQCSETGLGAMLLKRRVIDALYKKHASLSYRSACGDRSVALFNSVLAPDPRDRHGLPHFLGDDRAFCHRLRGAGYRIHAAIDARTSHKGLDGCLGAHVSEGAPIDLSMCWGGVHANAREVQVTRVLGET